MPGSWPCSPFFQRYRNGHRLLTRVKNALRPRPIPVKNYRARFTRDFRPPPLHPLPRVFQLAHGKWRVTLSPIRTGTDISIRFHDPPIDENIFFSLSFANLLKACANFVSNRIEGEREKERERESGKKRNESIRIFRRDRPIKIIKKISRRISTRFNRRENFFVG